MKRFAISLGLLVLALATFGAAQNVNPFGPLSDPCQNPQYLKLSSKVAVTSATTTELVPASGSTIVYVCGYSLTSVGTGTIQFETGTKVTTACDTNPVVITGAWLIPTTTREQTAGDRGVQFASAAGGSICLVTTSGTTSVNGFINYVQK